MSQSAFKTINRPLMPPALVALISFALGIALDRYFDFNWTTSLLIAVATLVSWLALNSSHKFAAAKLASILIACCATGAFWHHGCWNWFPQDDLRVYVQSESFPVCLKARIKGEGKYSATAPQYVFDARPNSRRTTFLIEPIAIRNGQQWESLGGIAKLIVHVPTHNFSFGDEVLIFGRLTGTRPPTSPGQFNFQDFYRAQSIAANVHVYEQDSILLQVPCPNVLSGWLSRLRKRLNQHIWNHVGEDQAGFASAILLGNREQLTSEQRERFVATGTAHLLAISGLHVGILASMFLLLYRVGLLKRKAALWATILFVIFYAWLVEFRPPVTRAAILLVLFCSGRLLGRSGFELNLLALAGILILAINPGDLFLLGPQLSFLAVAALILFKQHVFPPLSNDPIDVLVRGTRPWWVRTTTNLGRRCKQAVMVSGLLWLIGLPLIAANYHLVTPISLAANPIVMIPIAVALFCCLGVCVFGFVCSPVADGFGAGASNCLLAVQSVVDQAAEIEFGHWWTAGPVTLSIIVFYLAISSLALVKPERRPRLLISISLLWIGLFWLLPFHAKKLVHSNPVARCTFIHVGHGSAIWFQTAAGQNILFDAGSMSSSRFAADTISNVLWSNQIEHIDAVIISHADLDHFNALPELAQRFSIGVVFMSEPMADSSYSVVAELQDQLAARDVAIDRLSGGQLAQLGQWQQLQVLLPPRMGTGGNDNSNSIVISVHSDGQSILLPGDLEGAGMQMLLQMPCIDCDLIAMPHHGSRNSCPEEFVAWCSPEHVVISASATKTDRQVVEQISGDVKSVTSTGDVGSIQAEINATGIRLAHWSGDGWKELPERR